MGKKWWLSKTLWVNLISILAVVLANKTDINLSSEMQVQIIAVVNIILRLITRTELKW